MLPDFRFIALSVVASIVIVVAGFGLFAALRVANQSSAQFWPGGKTAFARDFSEIPEASRRLEPPATQPGGWIATNELSTTSGVEIKGSAEEVAIAVSEQPGNLAVAAEAPVGGPLVPIEAAPLDAAPGSPAVRAIAPAPQEDREAADVTGAIGAGPVEPIIGTEKAPADVAALASQPLSMAQPEQPGAAPPEPPTPTAGVAPTPTKRNANAPAKKRVARTAQARKAHTRRVARTTKPRPGAYDPNNPFANWFVAPPQTPAHAAGS